MEAGEKNQQIRLVAYGETHCMDGMVGALG